MFIMTKRRLLQFSGKRIVGITVTHGMCACYVIQCECLCRVRDVYGVLINARVGASNW